MEEVIRDVITCFKFDDDRFRGLASTEGQILPFPTDFDGRPYNTLTLPCERVIVFSPNTIENDGNCFAKKVRSARSMITWPSSLQFTS